MNLVSKKMENCQVGVFLGYTCGNRRPLIDERLYLPEDWANDTNRRKNCNVPDDIVFKTKAQLGLEMLLEAQKRGVPFAWVGMDCFYGEQPWLLDEIASKGLVYIADIPCETIIAVKSVKEDTSAMVEKQDLMLEKQDGMLKKQVITIDILKSLNEDIGEMKSHTSHISPMKEDTVSIRTDTREIAAKLWEKYEEMSKEIAQMKITLSKIEAKVFS